MATKATMPAAKGDPKSHAPEDFAQGMTGSCLCGAVRVTIRDGDLFTRRRGHLCHCANCRKVSGSFTASNFLIEADKVDIDDPSGSLKTFVDNDTLSGKPLYRFFCGVDGNPIKSESPGFPGKVIIKMGIFPRIPEPEMEGFALHRHPWEPSLEGTVKYKLTRGGEILEE